MTSKAQTKLLENMFFKAWMTRTARHAAERHMKSLPVPHKRNSSSISRIADLMFRRLQGLRTWAHINILMVYCCHSYRCSEAVLVTADLWIIVMTTLILIWGADQATASFPSPSWQQRAPFS